VYQLVLLLHQDIPVDIPDSQAHTALMWAAYKGYPSCVDLFLRWGANVYATDDQGFTALHWALVKGSQGSIQKLIEYGADRFAKNNDGKTPATTAEEMNTSQQWLRALSEAGYNKDGTPKEFPIPGVKDTRWFLNRLTFFWPFIIIFKCVYLLANYPVYVGAPVAAGVTFGLQWCVQKLLEWAPSNMRNIHHTPFMAGVFAGSLFWVGFCWLTTVLPCKFDLPCRSNAADKSQGRYERISFSTLYLERFTALRHISIASPWQATQGLCPNHPAGVPPRR